MQRDKPAGANAAFWWVADDCEGRKTSGNLIKVPPELSENYISDMWEIHPSLTDDPVI